jgi:molybdopterin molybdotransferase
MPIILNCDGTVEKIDYHGSAHINALCQADGLLCVPAGVKEIKEGANVEVRLI